MLKKPSLSKKKTLARRLTLGKTPLDFEIEKAYEKIVEMDFKEEKLNYYFRNNEFIFKYIQYIMTKLNKSPTDIDFMRLYLHSLKKFKSLFKNIESSILEDLMNRICIQIKCEQFDNNVVVCKQGDKGEKFYIILKGTVSVLISQEKQIIMTKTNYVKYLIMLAFYQENSLLEKTIRINKSIYYVDETSITSLLYIFNFFFLAEYHCVIKEEYCLISKFLEKEKKIYQFIFDELGSLPENFINIMDLPETKIMEIYDFFKELYTDNFDHEYYQTILHAKIEDLLIQNPIIYINTIINEKENKSYLYNISKEKYCKRINNLSSFESEDGVKIKVFTYSEVVELNEGDVFGDVALMKTEKKRTATIITDSECFFGTVTQAQYNMCFKSTQEKKRNLNCLFFINGPIFKGIKQNNFEKKYYNYFAQIELTTGNKLFSPESRTKNLYFIQKGELAVTCNLSISKVVLFIQELGGNVDTRKIRKVYDTSEEFQKIYSRKKILWKICVLKENEVAGFDSFMTKNNFFCDYECNAKHCQFFLLEERFLPILFEDQKIYANINDYINLKKKAIITRLTTLLNSYMSSYEKYKIRSPTTPNNSREKPKARLVYMSQAIKPESLKNFNVNRKIFTDRIMTETSSTHLPRLIYHSLNTSKLNNTTREEKSLSVSRNKNKDGLSLSSSAYLMKRKLKKKVNEKNITSYNSSKFSKEKDEKIGVNLSFKKKDDIETEKSTYLPSNSTFLRTMRTKKMFFIPKKGINGKTVKEYKINYITNRPMVKNTFYLKHPHIFDSIINPKTNKNKGIIDCLVLDNWAEKKIKSVGNTSSTM